MESLSSSISTEQLENMQLRNFTRRIENTLKTANSSKSFTDVIFSCENGRVEVSAHKSILSAASPFLSRIFEENLESSVIILPDTPAKIVKAALKLIYTGEANLKKNDAIAVMALCVDIGIMPFETSLSLKGEQSLNEIQEATVRVDEAVKKVINIENLQSTRTTRSNVKENVMEASPKKVSPKSPAKKDPPMKSPNSVTRKKLLSKDNSSSPPEKKLKMNSPKGKLGIKLQPHSNENSQVITVEIEEIEGESSGENEEVVEVTQIVEFEVASEIVPPNVQKSREIAEESNREPTAEEIMEATRQSSQKDHAYAFYNAKGSKLKNKLRGEAIALDERKRSDHNYFSTNIG